MATAAPPATRDVKGKNWYWKKAAGAAAASEEGNAPPVGKQPPPPTLDDVAENMDVTYIDGRTAPNGGLEAWALDTHGFCYFTPPEPVDFSDRELTVAEYGPKLVEQVRRLAGAREGFLYYHLVRGPDGEWKRFSQYIHADFGARAVPKWREELVGRFGVPEREAADCDLCLLNVWHPVGRPAYRDPLCLLDFSSLGSYADDHVPIHFSYPNLFYTSEQNQQKVPKDFARALASGPKKKGAAPPQSLLIGPTYSPNHRWVFCSDMRPDEAWLFKQYDTRPKVAACAFHNSFPDPFHAKDPDCPSRLSAEFRILLTFPKGGNAAAAAKL